MPTIWLTICTSSVDWTRVPPKTVITQYAKHAKKTRLLKWIGKYEYDDSIDFSDERVRLKNARGFILGEKKKNKYLKKKKGNGVVDVA